ncbi:MAG TPA: FecR domain-containing protein [Bacteroidales bacterium]|nr:FecR domain-containing protein [Bacteroidales bacterium]
MKNNNIYNKIIGRLISGDLPEGEENGNPEEMEVMDQYQTIIEQSKNITFPEFSAEKGLIKTEYKLQKLNHNNKDFKLAFLKIAAVIVLGVFIAYLILQQLADRSSNQFIEIYVKKGEKLNMKLPDGNAVWLNSCSSIKYPSNFNGFNKRIEVTGEAYFDLRNNTNYPVVICANNNIINCSSAAFNIKSDSSASNTVILVEKGWITVSNPEIVKDYEIKEGEKATLATYFPLAVEPGYSQNELAWRTGKIIFDNTPLQTVASTLSEYYDVNIQIEGEIRYCQFSSQYVNIDCKTILNDIQLQFKPSIIEKNNQIVIKGADCN